MAQYDPIVIKSGLAGVLGTDTLRADKIAAAGMTTGAPSSGDVCQVSSTNLTLQKASNLSTSHIVGVYDGISGSVVRGGIVVANFSGAVPAAGSVVYLSATAGQLTGTKPTMDMLHEVGVVVDQASGKILLQQKPVIALPPTPDLAIWMVRNNPWSFTKFSAATGAQLFSVSMNYRTMYGCYDGAGNVWGLYDTMNPGDTQQVYKYREADGVLQGQIALTTPNSVCSDGTYIYTDQITDWVGHRCHTRIKISDFSLLNIYETGFNLPEWGGSVGFYDYNGHVLRAATNPNSVVKFNTPGYDVNSISAPNTIVGCVYGLSDPTGTYGYLFCISDGCVKKVRLSDLAFVASWRNGNWNCETNGSVSMLAFDGTYLWVCDGQNNQVHKVDVNTGADVGVWGTGYWYTKSICFDGTYIWCYCDHGGGRLLKFNQSGTILADYLVGTGGLSLFVNRWGPSFKYIA